MTTEKEFHYNELGIEPRYLTREQRRFLFLKMKAEREVVAGLVVTAGMMSLTDQRGAR